VSRYQKKHSPTHHPDHPIFISFFHLPRSIASFLFKLHAWQSFCTTSLHVLFGLPLGLELSTSYSIHFFTQSVSSFRNTCPYHRNLFCCSIKQILYSYYNECFQDDAGLADSPSVFCHHYSGREPPGASGTCYFHGVLPSCHPASNVKALISTSCLASSFLHPASDSGASTTLRGYSIIGSSSGFTANLGSDSLGKSNDLGVSTMSRIHFGFGFIVNPDPDLIIE